MSARVHLNLQLRVRSSRTLNPFTLPRERCTASQAHVHSKCCEHGEHGHYTRCVFYTYTRCEFCNEHVNQKLLSGHSCWHRATHARCLCPSFCRGRQRKGERWHSKFSGDPAVCDSRDLRQDNSKLLKAGSEQAAAHLIYPAAPASTQGYTGWLLLQGMHCYHPDKIAAPIPIPSSSRKWKHFHL